MITHPPGLAGTRPVFRGLRPNTGRGAAHGLPEACRDETRFQGIATLPCQRPNGFRRFLLQGRDPFSGDCDMPQPQPPSERAVPQPCRDETRFQGIATGSWTSASTPWTFTLQGRDPFSGDCDRAQAARVLPFMFMACRDETRFQGIATGRAAGPRAGG